MEPSPGHTCDVACQTDPVPVAEYGVWKYHTDPNYRQKVIARAAQYNKERAAKDAEYAAKLKAQSRERVRRFREREAEAKACSEK